MIDKKIILSHCIKLLEQRIANSKQAMHEAQEASTSEEKSSAGDKYETARAMGHLNSEMNAKQLLQAQQELSLLNRIDIGFHPIAKQGSLIETETTLYFIGVGLGPLMIMEQQIVTLSAQAPLAKLLIGKEKGGQFILHSQTHNILNIL
jgi:hypothetical protein